MKKLIFTFLFLATLSGCNAVNTYETITLNEVEHTIKEGYVHLDVREPNEFNEGHIPGAINKPLSELQNNNFSNINEEEQYIVICRSGNRSKTASDILFAEGYEITNTSEGMSSWQGEIQ